MQEIFDENKKYYVDHNYMIAMNGEPDKWTNLTHAFNTFLNFYWTHFFSGGFWAQDEWLASDIREMQTKFIDLVNKSEGEMSIGILTFIEGLKPAPSFSKMMSKNYTYPNLMTYYDKDYQEHGYHPRQIFHKLMELLKHDSIQEFVKDELRKAKLPYMQINVIG